MHRRNQCGARRRWERVMLPGTATGCAQQPCQCIVLTWTRLTIVLFPRVLALACEHARTVPMRTRQLQTRISVRPLAQDGSAETGSARRKVRDDRDQAAQTGSAVCVHESSPLYHDSALEVRPLPETKFGRQDDAAIGTGASTTSMERPSAAECRAGFSGHAISISQSKRANSDSSWRSIAERASAQ